MARRFCNTIRVKERINYRKYCGVYYDMMAIVRVFFVLFIVATTFVATRDASAAVPGKCYMLRCDSGYYYDKPNNRCVKCPSAKTCCKKDDPDCVPGKTVNMTTKGGELHEKTDCKLPAGMYQNDVGCFEVTSNNQCGPRQ